MLSSGGLYALAGLAVLVSLWLAVDLFVRKVLPWFRLQLARFSRKSKSTRGWIGRRLLRVAPYPHSVLRAVLWTALVLVASFGAPQLSRWVGKILACVTDTVPFDFCDCLIVAVIAGFSTAILLLFLSEKATVFCENVLDRLSGKAHPDFDVERVNLNLDRAVYGTGSDKPEFNNLEEARQDAQEWMIILRQAGLRGRYTIGCIEEQLNKLWDRVEKINDKRRERLGKDRLPVADRLEVKWVCFVSRKGRFHAFQPYKTFCFHILVKKNSRYVAILNKISEKEFAKALETERQLSERYTIKDATNTEREAIVPDAIPDLDTFWIRKGLTADKALDIMIKEHKGRAMIVSERRNHEPLGVLTMTELARRKFYEPLVKADLYESAITDANKGEFFDDHAPGFNPP